MQIQWEDVYFPDAAFPISDFLHDEANQLRIWDLRQGLTAQLLVQELLAYQPVVLGISDHHSTNGLVLERLIKQMFPRALVFFSVGHIEPEELLDKANQSAFRLRQRTRPVAGKMRFRSSWSDADLLEQLAPLQPETAQARIADFEARYQLGAWRQYLPLGAYIAMLETLELLEDCFPASHPIWQLRQIRVLDVGAARWAYAPAMVQFFTLAYTEQARQVYLTGIELDPYRLDDEGYSCADYALSYLDPVASQIRYLNQDVLTYTPQQAYDLVTLFRPYLTRQEHLIGGLPLEFYRPEALIGHLLSVLQPDGMLIISHNRPENLPEEHALIAAVGGANALQAAFCSQLSQQWRGFVTLLSPSAEF